MKGYAGHERQTFDELARLRSAGQAQADVGARAQTEQAISTMIGRVLAVAEAELWREVGDGVNQAA